MICQVSLLGFPESGRGGLHSYEIIIEAETDEEVIAKAFEKHKLFRYIADIFATEGTKDLEYRVIKPWCDDYHMTEYLDTQLHSNEWQKFSGWEFEDILRYLRCIGWDVQKEHKKPDVQKPPVIFAYKTTTTFGDKKVETSHEDNQQQAITPLGSADRHDSRS